MFEALVRDIARRFGLGDKADDLLGALLSVTFDERSGGIAGLLEKFRQQGLGDLFGSWLGNDQPAPIEPQQLDNALGANTISGIADRLGIERGTALAAASAMLPKLIGLLTPDGRLPNGIPNAVSGYLGNVGQLGDKIGGTLRDAESALPASVPAGGLGWLKWLVLAAIVLALGWCMLDRKPEPSVPASSEAPRAAPAAPNAEPRLSLANDAGKLSYSGTLGSEAERSRLVDALNAAFGAGNVSGNVAVDANTRPAGWLAALGGLLPEFVKAPGAKLDLDGGAVTLGGATSEAEHSALAGLLKDLFGSFKLRGLEPSVVQSASEAFKSLRAGSYGAADLVKALNLMTIHFDTGSAAISADSLDILKEAAEALKNAPAGTRVEIGGHTDDTGNAAANLKLSEERATAVRAKLVDLGVKAEALTAKGYGDTKPIADNGTEEGRAKNRRMEFAVVE